MKLLKKLKKITTVYKHRFFLKEKHLFRINYPFYFHLPKYTLRINNLSHYYLININNLQLKIFYTEHLHDDDEIRFILDGSGYFDIRDLDDNWIRLWTRKGDMIVIPAGSYHRFSTDENVSEAEKTFTKN